MQAGAVDSSQIANVEKNQIGKREREKERHKCSKRCKGEAHWIAFAETFACSNLAFSKWIANYIWCIFYDGFSVLHLVSRTHTQNADCMFFDLFTQRRMVNNFMHFFHIHKIQFKRFFLARPGAPHFLHASNEREFFRPIDETYSWTHLNNSNSLHFCCSHINTSWVHRTFLNNSVRKSSSVHCKCSSDFPTFIVRRNRIRLIKCMRSNFCI